MERFWHFPCLTSGKNTNYSTYSQYVKYYFKALHINFSILHLHRQNRYSIIIARETQVGAAVNVSPMMAANNPTFTNMMNEFNKNTQTLMIVSKDDLENVVQNAVNRLLEKRENKPEVYLSVEETARRLKVDRSTLWRWNKDGYLTTTKVGNKVRYKLSDVERIQKGEVYE